MKQTAYGKPLFLNSNNEVSALTKVEADDELAVQELIFNNPDCLPISDIDESYNPITPVCMELNTTVGPLDILLISPNGDLTIVETKLWRNPEARRKVVAQILDYAQELSNWTYEDLQRETNKRLKRKGNTLYNLVRDAHEELVPPESDFVDSVSRNLERGRFLLLIAGDGIREGTIAIAEFLSSASHLSFTFAMVELNIYSSEGIGTLIIPKTLVKTTEISKMTVEIPKGFLLTKSEDFEATALESALADKDQERNFYSRFWKELVAELNFDDPGQPIPKPGTAQNLYVYPGKSKKAWISAYFAKSQKRVGVYFRVQNDPDGKSIFEALSAFKSEMQEEFGKDAIWNWDENGFVSTRFPCEDVFDDSLREEIKDFFKTWLNTFVNVLRPRIKNIHSN